MQTNHSGKGSIIFIPLCKLILSQWEGIIVSIQLEKSFSLFTEMTSHESRKGNTADNLPFLIIPTQRGINNVDKQHELRWYDDKDGASFARRAQLKSWYFV